MKPKTTILPRTLMLVFGFILASNSVNSAATDTATKMSQEQRVVQHYAQLAHAIYKDAWSTAKVMQEKIAELVKNPLEKNLQDAKSSWKSARVYYQQSEVFRFGHSIVDKWESQVNAWPLDEGFIDYVKDDDYDYVYGNKGAQANIIARNTLTIGASELDISEIKWQLLLKLNEYGGSEANVATGYHAIEFLLWGQDINGSAFGAGKRKASDYAWPHGCTHQNCERRAAYLQAVAQLLVNDLAYMAGQWSETGDYYRQLMSEPANASLKKMLYGMGALSFGELAGERMKVALEANSSEDEHDCFSDNTHNAHYYSALGVQNIYLGRYVRYDGSRLAGPSLSQLVHTINPKLNEELSTAFELTMSKMKAMVNRAEHKEYPMTFDMMIAEGNSEGKRLISEAIDALAAQTVLIEQMGRALGVGLGSDP